MICTGVHQTKCVHRYLSSRLSFKCNVVIVSAHAQNQMDKELHHNRGALHMEAFIDAEMWEFSKTERERDREKTQDERKNPVLWAWY